MALCGRRSVSYGPLSIVPDGVLQPSQLAVRDVLQDTFQELLRTTGCPRAFFSPDGGGMLVISDAADIHNVYAIPLEGGAPTAVTSSKEKRSWLISF
jgi:hypothetical protein